MAKIELNAYVSDWKYGTDEKNPNWAMKVSEPHYKKVGEKMEKIGATNYTIKAGWDEKLGQKADIDFSKFGSGERVAIKGTLVSESWESNGVKGKNLVIKATEVDVIERGDRLARSAGSFDRTPDGWVEVDSELPF